MTVKPRSREELYNRQTCYEIVAYLPTGKLRLGFTSRPNKRTILDLARQYSDEILKHVTDDSASYTAKYGWMFGGVRVGKSGRTEYECAGEEN